MVALSFISILFVWLAKVHIFGHVGKDDEAYCSFWVESQARGFAPSLCVRLWSDQRNSHPHAVRPAFDTENDNLRVFQRILVLIHKKALILCHLNT